ncbi:NADH-quinone oxidoreductase subunit B family protein [endosymbiont of Ridgeia piscesae]|jgi:coenzyme F420-reducing hydrogenase gamma subunit|uniref:Coenzyme F420-reducing hydrogenase gamma subunit n=1 Tax=endosymbiont of Ridgeia piscesae TaxID=54398 RepID=A0A0T5ZBT5_9GAMM|nr:sulfhydrogenase subunit delta [endosymbiont of Ridgeia piscesae]KRT54291.1 Coenzyme F420-reducing hydrogenase subunit gamma [endosymbiont of Ridgeia piscesae]KRT60317.1 Coenzyme F420-reducing hydrogenase gamma subunit [endosymbiont of Ridgeia piscesae]
MMRETKPTLAVHKFSSCDGCQLALLNLGEALLELPNYLKIVHFAEAGPSDPTAHADLALVEGSISTPEDVERIRQVRKNSDYLISIGACATAGGIQALRNLADAAAWMAALYPQPEQIEILPESGAIAAHVKVDLELPGCPVNSNQLLRALRDLLNGVEPVRERRALCMECKRQGLVCTLVSSGQPCLGPVTLAGCGALCPSQGRGCYGCYGPVESVHHESLAQRFSELGLDQAASARRFLFIQAGAPTFAEAGVRLRARATEEE